MKRIQTFFKKNVTVADIILIILFVIPSFISLLNNQYFTMHDDQHIARLFLFDKALREGEIYPRWVDQLGFGYGYPLFNFYPPLIYFVAEGFYLLGFSLIWSIKLMVISGFILGAIGMYLFTKRVFGRWPAIMSAVLYTYFFYHAVTAYVRGSFAEFFAMTVLPFVLYAMDRVADKKNVSSAILFGITIALLMINHPLIAFPSVFYIAFFCVFYFFNTPANDRVRFSISVLGGGVLGLLLSAFFWVPSILEKQYTYVDEILTRELASYKIHFVYLSQLWQSNWAYGGSIEGPFDGMTFQLGKIHIVMVVLSVIGICILGALVKKWSREMKYYAFFVFLLLFSIFMTTVYSSFIWDAITFLWYLQFPWRFMTFIAMFISLTGAFAIYAGKEIVTNIPFFQKRKMLVLVGTGISVLVLSGGLIAGYSKYFRPQEYRAVTDADLTSFNEVVWRISRTSFEFVPKGVKTTTSELGTTILDITPDELPKTPYEIEKGNARVRVDTLTARKKIFTIQAEESVVFRLNTYNFPGWKAYSQKLGRTFEITDANDLKLSTVKLPAGTYDLQFEFTNTPVRTVSNGITIASLAGVFTYAGYLLLKRKKV